MQQLVRLAALLAGVADIFVDLVPKWALGEIHDQMMRHGVIEEALTRIRLQDWLLKQGIPHTERSILAFFLLSSNGDTITRSEFVHVRTPPPHSTETWHSE